MPKRNYNKITFYIFLILGVLGLIEKITVEYEPFSESGFGLITQLMAGFIHPVVGSVLILLFELTAIWVFIAIALKMNWWKLKDKSLLVLKVFAAFIIFIVLSTFLNLYINNSNTSEDKVSAQRDLPNELASFVEQLKIDRPVPYQTSGRNVYVKNIESIGTTVVYSYAIQGSLLEAISLESARLGIIKLIEDGEREKFCQYPPYKDFLIAGAVFKYDYYSILTGEFLHSGTVTWLDCIDFSQ
jgi:hypothetical protein